MEKENANPIVNSQSVNSKAVASKRGASVPDAVPATDDAAGASAVAAGRGQIPPEWDPYEELPYIRPWNPYDELLIYAAIKGSQSVNLCNNQMISIR